MIRRNGVYRLVDFEPSDLTIAASIYFPFWDRTRLAKADSARHADSLRISFAPSINAFGREADFRDEGRSAVYIKSYHALPSESPEMTFASAAARDPAWQPVVNLLNAFNAQDPEQCLECWHPLIRDHKAEEAKRLSLRALVPDLLHEPEDLVPIGWIGDDQYRLLYIAEQKLVRSINTSSIGIGVSEADAYSDRFVVLPLKKHEGRWFLGRRSTEKYAAIDLLFHESLAGKWRALYALIKNNQPALARR